MKSGARTYSLLGIPHIEDFGWCAAYLLFQLFNRVQPSSVLISSPSRTPELRWKLVENSALFKQDCCLFMKNTSNEMENTQTFSNGT